MYGENIYLMDQGRKTYSLGAINLFMGEARGTNEVR